jgi:hypothetical protein
MALEMIVSGGQTGVDRGALDAALAAGFPCGGWCPRGRAAEDGPLPLAYPLVELPGAGYRRRTTRNVTDSDGTAIVYFDRPEGGTEQTLLDCIRKGRPYKLLDATLVTADQAAGLLLDFVHDRGVKRLNVAGPRQSGEPRAYRYAFEMVAALVALARDRSPAS